MRTHLIEMPYSLPIKTIKGVEHKLCRGALHLKGGEFVPLDKFWRISRNGKESIFHRCKDCVSFERYGLERGGFVDVDKVRFIFEELEARLGRIEASRRLGASKALWGRLKRKEHKRMRIHTAHRAMTVLLEVRVNNEVRHRKSILHGSALRGREEKIPTTQDDFYKRGGDSENEYRRKRRAMGHS